MGSNFNPRWFWTAYNIKEVLKILPELNKPIFHICSGISNIGDVRVDRSYINLPFDHKYWVEYQGSCNIKGDMNNLPIKSGVAGSVICDPPYDYDFTKNELINELVRICKPGGKIVFIAPWIPDSLLIKINHTELWHVGKNRPYYKIMSLITKVNGQIEDYLIP